MFVTRKRYDSLLQERHINLIELNRLMVELKHKDIETVTLEGRLAEMKEERDAERVRAELAVDRVLEARAGVTPISDPIRNTGHSLQDLLRDGDAMHAEDPAEFKEMMKEIEEDGLSASLESRAKDSRDQAEDE